jgi:uncharacterized membrane protein
MYLLYCEVAFREEVFIASLFLAVSPMRAFSQLARNFSLMTLLVTFSYLILLTRLFKRFDLRYGILYGITVFLALLTHYYSIFFILTQMIMIILWELRRQKLFLRWVIIFALITIGYLPWLPALYVQMFLRDPTLKVS